MLRYNVTTGDWVIFAPARAARPHEFPRERDRAGDAAAENHCPFCPGNERLTPPEIYALREPAAANSPGWRIRVVPNRYPALQIEHDVRRFEEGPLFRYMAGCGAHEVLIESPDHDAVLCHQPVEHIDLLLRTMQARFNDLLRDSRFQMIVLFKNHGERAGTSLRHPHCQLIATPVVPRLLRLKLRVATEYFDQTGHCLYCTMLSEELTTGERVVADNEQFAAITPYASHSPFETWILPKRHQASFGRVDDGQFRPLAELLQAVLLKLYSGLDDPAFNLTVNTVPRGEEQKEYFLWHLQIVPRLATAAGFELGSGMSINTVLPEEAARFLRAVQVG
jgi:UDPglucose--hexose-1-phosphate uridylyltransferase